ncbi:sucrose-6-phosphate hydrolase [Pontibacillus yanchengensis]|uniref:Sucrose-6-phosphate hydrolase n=2 Tax=Pontibacillus yanchengensis TaxID=462910 RepID=A0ACC7VFN4_9BACI|nr:sucrose-6-phosphate hydrolase [Pontibacillus yanchengensis]MYL32154.1 sucrose-6-phosphate hydrolase [Pontibacillus yanchengensis]MYL52734.1 sucrose-6-phosphate hydrolase [Pontibacillus yanchengensis]
MDFSNRQNRFVPLSDVSADYLKDIEQKTKTDEFYPSYHIAPHHGLLNDPNGLAFYNGEHHIFYQWFPLGPVHGLKHWYHVSTKDFVHYTDHGIALFPDQSYDSHGCFSGSALVENDELHLFYTGNHLTPNNEPYPTQCYAKMLPTNDIEKYGVIADVNDADFTRDYRDPVVFKRKDTYYMLVGGKTRSKLGALALYEGRGKDSLTYKGIVNTQFDEFGYMWECPNYFEKEDKGVFIFSPQGLTSEDPYSFKNVFSVVYVIGEKMDVDNRKFTHDSYYELDKGFDFYAPQTYEDNEGRRILIGWLGNSKSEYPTDKNMWAHMLTIPRTLSIEGDKLIQNPIEDLESLRREETVILSEVRVPQKAFELELSVDSQFELSLSNDAGDSITFSSNGDEYCLDRSDMTYVYAERFGTKRFAERKVTESHTIQIFVDHSSIEIFCDNGETVFTSRFFITNLSTLTITDGVSGKLFRLASIDCGVVRDATRRVI